MAPLRAAVVVVGLVLLTACGNDLSNDDSTRDEEGTVTEGGEVGALSLQVGDCIETTGPASVDSLPVVPCNQPHEVEVFAVFDLPEGLFPGEVAINEAFEEGCNGDRFEDYVGVPYLESALVTEAITPTQETWDGLDDREIVCLARNIDGSNLNETIRDSRR